MKIALVVALSLCVTISGAELPVRTVVLYKHGVGYFERGGTLGPGESARLDFKTDEMNDVLKSLTITEQGGKVTGLRYDSSIPLDQKLGDFPFRIQAGQPLSAVIDQLKGARIEMEFGPQKVEGEIVSARLIAAEKDKPEREQLTLLMDSGELRNVDLAAATSIRFPDAKLQLQFRDYLGVLADARSKDRRSVYIDSADAKARDVRASYIIPMPAWKSSYRLLFAESGEPTLEGWAIVDNTTGEDWTNVHLSLVSGKPISFVSQLYAPKYVSRLGAELPEDQAVAPTVYSGAIRKDIVGRINEPQILTTTNGTGGGGIVGGVPGGIAGRPLSGILGSIAAPPPPPGFSSSVAPAGPAQEIADLFEYTIANPVTVRKDGSSMMPFLQQKIAARKLIIYSDSGKPNPFSAAEITNNTGKTLDGGPITVFDAGAYAGEALVETFKNADKRFINYGVDLGTRVATNLDSRNDGVREVHAHNGLLVAKSALVQKKTYSVVNVDARAKTLIVEHPVRIGFHLIDTPKPTETTSAVYRFEIALPAKGSVDFPVTEENIYDTQVSVSSLNPDVLSAYVRNKNIGDNARALLRQIADLKTQIANAVAQRRSLDDQINGVTSDEERNRQNIASLSSVSGQQQIVQDYARKLADQETQIGKLRDQAAAIERQRDSLQAQLDERIEKLDF